MNALATTIKQLFKGMKWFETSEYVLLMLLVVALPIYWQLGVWMLAMLCVNMVVKIVATRRIGNPALWRATRVCLYLMMLVYLLYAASILYTSQPREAVSTITMMLPLLLFPLLTLLGDTRYITRRHISTLVYLLAAVLSLRFVVMLVRSLFHTIDSQLFSGLTELMASSLAGIASYIAHASPIPILGENVALLPVQAAAHLFVGTPLEKLPQYKFDPLHHNYLSLYLLTAVALLYCQLVHHWHQPSWKKCRWVVVADMATLSTYVLLSGSRSGVVIWTLLAAACFIHMTFCLHRWRVVGITVAAIALLVGCSYWASPKTYERITSTAHSLLTGQQGDVRQELWSSGLETARKHLLIGYGCDGYWETLFKQYHADESFYASNTGLSTHNQYIETLLATGIVGLAALILMVLVPVVLALRPPPGHLSLILFTLVYAASFFFEAMLGRQMGLLFISVWYCILSHPQRQSEMPTAAPHIEQ
ncbi:MAG: O-antigen ligase family protein [Bacteroidales bacterium]|nr:O-antigen ligase family protein [Bacteroidales bacterium]